MLSTSITPRCLIEVPHCHLRYKLKPDFGGVLLNTLKSGYPFNYATSNPTIFADRHGLVYGDGVLEFEDVIFGPTYWLRTKLGLDPSISKTTTNLVTGVGDGAFEAITLGIGDLNELRNIVGIDGGVETCSTAYKAGFIGGNTVGGVAIGGAVAKSMHKLYQAGREISIGKNFRLAPFGNRTGHEIGKYPHYHRRGIDLVTGQTRPGQEIGRHRPWERKSTDTSFWDRF